MIEYISAFVLCTEFVHTIQSAASLQMKQSLNEQEALFHCGSIH
jgi:hypothetical protein